MTLQNVQALVTAATPAEQAWVRSYLTWRDPQAVHDPRFQSGEWDGTHTVWDARRQCFPAGLAGLVVRGAGKAGHQVELAERRTPPAVQVRPVPEGWLRDYQAEAFKACLSTSAMGAQLPGRGIVQIATGGGKTNLAIALGFCVPIQWLFLVNSQDLLEQTAKRYERITGEKSGRIGDGMWDPGRFTVATVQTLSTRTGAAGPFLAGIQGVIVDECHGAASDTPQEVLGKLTNAYYRIGLSATPLGREDKKDLLTIGAVGPVIYRVSAHQLQAKGVLSGARITFVRYEPQARTYWHKVEALARYDKKRAYMLAYNIGIVNNSRRNVRVVDIVRAAEKPCLTFVKHVQHGDLLRADFRRAGLRVEFVAGRDGSRERQDEVKSLVRGDLDVLISTSIFNQGVDIPELRSLVNAAGGKSETITIQRLGRGTRVSDGKSMVHLYDFEDTGPFLANHAKTRQQTYQRAGYTVKVTD